MTGNSKQFMLFLTSPRNVRIIQALRDYKISNIETLNKKLSHSTTRGELLRSLRIGEMLGLIEKSRNGKGEFEYKITPQADSVLCKYMSLLKEIEKTSSG